MLNAFHLPRNLVLLATPILKWSNLPPALSISFSFFFLLSLFFCKGKVFMPHPFKVAFLSGLPPFHLSFILNKQFLLISYQSWLPLFHKVPMTGHCWGLFILLRSFSQWQSVQLIPVQPTQSNRASWWWSSMASWTFYHFDMDGKFGWCIKVSCLLKSTKLLILGPIWWLQRPVYQVEIELLLIFEVPRLLLGVQIGQAGWGWPDRV